ncbi:MAG: type II secretion system minor pseudopilin GspI [Pseudomonadota bacterium]
MSKQSGFTLIEVMVALVIVAVGLSTISVSLSQHASNSRKLRDMTLASFIAGNTLTTLRLQPEFPDIGRSTDELEFANREWLVTTFVQESGIEGLRRADVSIAEAVNPDRNIRTVTGFVSSVRSLPRSQLPSFSGLGNSCATPCN